VTGPEITETVVGAVTFLTLTSILCAREAIKRGWVKFSLSMSVVPLDKRVTAPVEIVVPPMVIPGTVVEQGRAA
jgi:hypothetical protein